jgi:hypothetical protein
MAKITYRAKKITLSANDVATIQYIKSQIEPIIGRDLTEIDVIRFCLDYFIKVDEAIEKAYDLLYKEVESNEKSRGQI